MPDHVRRLFISEIGIKRTREKARPVRIKIIPFLDPEKMRSVFMSFQHGSGIILAGVALI